MALNPDMTPEFWRWFNAKEEQLYLNDAQVAQLAKVSKSTISRARSKHQAIGHDALIRIAEALGEDGDFVLRLAGLLPKPPHYSAALEEWMSLAANESEETVREWAGMIKASKRAREKERDAKTKKR